MQDLELQRRRQWARFLIRRIEEANLNVKRLAVAAGSAGECALMESRRCSEDAIASKRAIHLKRVMELKESLSSITELMNEWHDFRKSPETQRKWSYPFLLLRKARESEKKRHAIQDRIQVLVLQNRLLDEEIRSLADGVSRNGLSRIAATEENVAWQHAVEARDLLLKDLCLVLASIPDTACFLLDPDNLSEVAARLSETGSPSTRNQTQESEMPPLFDETGCERPMECR